MKIALIGVLMLFAILSCMAQEVETFEVDSITKQISKSLPFDKKFILKIRTDEKPPYVEFLQNTGNRSWTETIRLKLMEDSIFNIPTIPSEQVDFRKEGGKNFLFITFGAHPIKYKMVTNNGLSKLEPSKAGNNFLKPARKYTLILPQTYSEASTVFDLVHQKDDVNAIAAIKKLEEKTEKVIGLTYRIQPIDSAKAFYTDSLQALYTLELQ